MAAERIGTVLAWAALAALVYAALLIVWPFLVPLTWAAVLATVFYRPFEKLDSRWGPGWSAGAVTLVASVVVVGPLLVVSTLFVREALQAAAALQAALDDGRYAWVQQALDDVQQRIAVAEKIDIGTLAADAVKRGALAIASQSAAAFRNVGGFVLDVVVTLFATFFLLRDSGAIMRVVRQLLPIGSDVRERLIVQIRQLVSVSVTSSLLVASAQGALGGVVFALVGIKAPVFWGVVMMLFCLLPLGAWLIWLPAAIILALDGELGRALVVGGLGVGLVSAVDNVLRPALLSGGAEMNGLVILISLLGGISAFGVIGFVVGPIVMATTIALLNTYLATQASAE